MKLMSTWLPLSFAFWIGAAVPLIVYFIVKSDIPNELLAGASTALIPTALFAWPLSNRLNFKLPNLSTCALLGLVYGVAHIIVFSLSLHYLTQQLTAHIQIAHFVNGLYMFGAPWLMAIYASEPNELKPSHQAES
jgi:hypothetical protein